MHTLQLSIFQSSIKIYCFFLLLLLPIAYRKVSLSRSFCAVAVLLHRTRKRVEIYYLLIHFTIFFPPSRIAQYNKPTNWQANNSKQQ